MPDNTGSRPSNDGPLDDTMPRQDSASNIIEEWVSPTTGTLFTSIGTGTTGTLNAWTITGGSPTILTNVLTMPAGGGMTAGHPDWRDGTVSVRMQWATGSGPSLHLRSPQAGIGGVFCYQSPSAFVLQVGFSDVGYVATAFAPVNGTWYWMTLQMAGNIATAKLWNDSAGAIGSLIATLSFDASVGHSTPLPATGRMALGEVAGAACHFGGAFANVCQVTGPIPANWVPTPDNTKTEAAFCWSNQNAFRGGRSLSMYIPTVISTDLPGWYQVTGISEIASTNYTYNFAAWASAACTMRWTDNSVFGNFRTMAAPFNTWTTLPVVTGSSGVGGTRAFGCVVVGNAGPVLVYFDYCYVLGPSGLVMFEDFEQSTLSNDTPLAYGRIRPSNSAPLF